MKNYYEFCNEQAEKLFKIIEQHNGLLEWRKTWNVNGCVTLPKSIHGYYQGINLWKLLSHQIDSGLVSDKWLTFNQIKQQGDSVLKGVKGTSVCFFKMMDKKEESLKEDAKNYKAVLRTYIVFNLDQTTLRNKSSENLVPTPQQIENLLSSLNVHVSEFGNRACYDPKADLIIMPKREHFEKALLQK